MNLLHQKCSHLASKKVDQNPVIVTLRATQGTQKKRWLMS